MSFFYLSVANPVDQSTAENHGTDQNYVSLTKQDTFFEDWRFTPNGPASAASTVEVEENFMQTNNSNNVNVNTDLEALDRCLEQHQLDYVGNQSSSSLGLNSDNELVHSIRELKLPKQELAEAVVPTRDLDLDTPSPAPNSGKYDFQ